MPDRDWPQVAELTGNFRNGWFYITEGMTT